MKKALAAITGEAIDNGSILKRRDSKAVYLYYAAAVIISAALYGWYFYRIHYGVGVPDEAFYLTITKKLLQGESLFVNEWHPTQTASMAQLLPYFLFTKITGGTEGTILFMREVYLASSFITYWYIIYKLRANEIHALISSFLFCAYVPFGIFAPGYYNLPPLLLLFVCFELGYEGTVISMIKQIICGIIFSLSVLLCPGFTAIYLIYTVLVFIKLILKAKKNMLAPYDRFFTLKTWEYLTIGVGLSAAAFLVFIQVTGGLTDAIKALTPISADPEYNIGFTIYSRKIEWILLMFRPMNLVLCGFTFLSLVYYNIRKKRNKLVKMKALISAFSAILMILMCICSLLKQIEIHSENLESLLSAWLYLVVTSTPIYIFVVINFFLTERKKPQWGLFLSVGFLSSLFKDLLSDVTIGIGFILAVIPAYDIIKNLIAELSEELPARSRRKAITAGKNKSKAGSAKTSFDMDRTLKPVIVCFIVLLVFWYGYNVFDTGMTTLLVETYNGSDKNAVVRIKSGPYKSLYTSPEINAVFEDMNEDLKRIEKTVSGPVYMPALMPYGYICIDNPISGYSAWCMPYQIDLRQLYYWYLHPDKLPEAIYLCDYVPYTYKKNSTEFGYYKIACEPENYKQICDFEMIEGKAGKILIVKSWNDFWPLIQDESYVRIKR